MSIYDAIVAGSVPLPFHPLNSDHLQFITLLQGFHLFIYALHTSLFKFNLNTIHTP